MSECCCYAMIITGRGSGASNDPIRAYPHARAGTQEHKRPCDPTWVYPLARAGARGALTILVSSDPYPDVPSCNPLARVGVRGALIVPMTLSGCTLMQVQVPRGHKRPWSYLGEPSGTCRCSGGIESPNDPIRMYPHVSWYTCRCPAGI